MGLPVLVGLPRTGGIEKARWCDVSMSVCSALSVASAAAISSSKGAKDKKDDRVT